MAVSAHLLRLMRIAVMSVAGLSCTLAGILMGTVWCCKLLGILKRNAWILGLKKEILASVKYKWVTMTSLACFGYVFMHLYFALLLN